MWPFRRKRDPMPTSEATLARKKAERDLAETRAETEKYRQLGERLREIREHNHLAEAFARSLRGRES